MTTESVAPPTEEAAERERPPFETIRYREDYRFLLEGHAPDPFDVVKFIPFGRRGGFLSLGGEFRSRYERFRNPDFGPRERNDFFLLRGLAHADLHVTRNVRMFLQLTSLHALGSNAVSPLDVNTFDVQQGFMDASFSLGNRLSLLVRAGRQEVALGSARLIGIRKGPNFRRSFDMARLELQGEWFSVLALGGLAVQPGPDVLDDPPQPEDALWGLYSRFDVARERRFGLDAYYLGRRREDAAFDDGAGTELRHSVGLRGYGLLGSFDYNTEVVLQAGTIGRASVLAWTVANDVGYTAVLGDLSVRMGAKVDVTSGDRQPGDGRVGTFDALYPNLKYFSEAGLTVPSNIADLHPSLGVEFRGVSLDASWGTYWRTSTADGLYTPPGLLFAGSSSAHRFLGHQATAELSAPFTRHLSLTFYYAYYFAGPAIEAAGGVDSDFFGSWVELVF